MSIWSVLTSGFVTAIGDAIDKNVTSDEERLILKNQLVKLEFDSAIKSTELENEYQKEITKRWESDNQSSELARNVRPLTLIFLLIVLSAMAFSSGNIGEFTIDPSFIDLFKMLAMTAFGAYFGGRSWEKGKGIK